MEAELASWAVAPPLAPTVARLGAYRGIAQLTGLTLAAEVVDWRRFATARAFMGFAGLIPSEYSSGERTRRGQITKAGPVGVRTALIEAAWPTSTGQGSGRDLYDPVAVAWSSTHGIAWAYLSGRPLLGSDVGSSGQAGVPDSAPLRESSSGGVYGTHFARHRL